MSSYYNNIPIYETINVNYGNVETLDTTTLKTKNLYIDNVKSSNKIITQNLTLDTDNIESLSKASTSPYTSDNNKITSKGYVDEQINNNVGKKYLVSDVVKGEIFNDYTNNVASGDKSHAEGTNTTASGDYSHAEGASTTASGFYSHAEGGYTQATKNYSHAEGYNTKATGTYSHAEGDTTTASGSHAHAEGSANTASGNNSHAEGYDTKAQGNYSHAEGGHTTSSGDNSHAGGFYTKADQINQTAIGKYNTTSNTGALLSVGNGTADNARSDAFVVKSTGEVIINSTAGTSTLTIGTSKGITATTALNTSTQPDDAILTTKHYVDMKIPSIKMFVSHNAQLLLADALSNTCIMNSSYCFGYIDTIDNYIFLTGSFINEGQYNLQNGYIQSSVYSFIWIDNVKYMLYCTYNGGGGTPPNPKNIGNFYIADYASNTSDETLPPNNVSNGVFYCFTDDNIRCYGLAPQPSLTTPIQPGDLGLYLNNIQFFYTTS